MSSEITLLRPHHGMCMAYFTGYGYSYDFTANMVHLLETLTPESPVCLTVGTDAVCCSCPHNSGEQCDKPELVAAWDREVLDLCGLGEGYILKFGDFTRLVQDDILEIGLRHDICGACEWNDLCASRSQSSRWAEKTEKQEIPSLQIPTAVL